MLGVKASQQMIDRLVMECIDSPQTMQSLCENVGYYLPGDKTLTDEAITRNCRMKAITKNEIYDRAKELLDTDRTKVKLTPQTVAGIIRGMVKVLEKAEVKRIRCLNGKTAN